MQVSVLEILEEPDDRKLARVSISLANHVLDHFKDPIHRPDLALKPQANDVSDQLSYYAIVKYLTILVAVVVDHRRVLA